MNNALAQMIALATGAAVKNPAEPTDLPEWKRKSRANQPARVAAPPDLNREHRASVLSEPVKFKRPKLRGKRNGAKVPTQHERVVMSRAARLGLPVKEYEIKYPSNWKTEREYEKYLDGLLEASERDVLLSQTVDEIPF